jgi:hypothetical protein
LQKDVKRSSFCVQRRAGLELGRKKKKRKGKPEKFHFEGRPQAVF